MQIGKQITTYSIQLKIDKENKIRIQEGHFKLNGVTYNLTINDGNNTLHGGVTGWDKKNWKSSVHGDKVVFK